MWAKFRLKFFKCLTHFSRRSQNLLFFCSKWGSKELNHSAIGDLKNDGRGVERGSWPPDIPVPPFQASAPGLCQCETPGIMNLIILEKPPPPLPSLNELLERDLFWNITKWRLKFLDGWDFVWFWLQASEPSQALHHRKWKVWWGWRGYNKMIYNVPKI